MFDHIRQSMAWLHTWSGLLLTWLLFFIFLTGTLGYFDTAIDRWMKPELPYNASFDDFTPAIDAAQTYLQDNAINATSWYLTLPEPRNPYLHVKWYGTQTGEALFDIMGNRLSHRQTSGGQWLYELHFKLHYLPIKLAYWIVCCASIVMLVALISGVIIHKKILIDFFTFRTGKRARTWLDLHNLLSVSALPFHLMITYSGLLFLSSTFQAPVYDTVYEVKDSGYHQFYDEFFGPVHRPASGISATPASLNQILADARKQWDDSLVRLITVHNPNDRNSVTRLIRMIGPKVSSSDRLYYQTATGEKIPYTPVSAFSKNFRMAMVNLHEGLFAGPVLRWLFFISGLAGAGMIATGLIVWVQKRRKKRIETFGYRANELLERANTGVLLGSVVAICVYFWANRLIPLHLPGRAAVEQNAFFLALLLCLLWCLYYGRGAHKHLLGLIAALYGLLPLADYGLGKADLIHAVIYADLTLIGFNLVLLTTSLAALTYLFRTTAPSSVPERKVHSAC